MSAGQNILNQQLNAISANHNNSPGHLNHYNNGPGQGQLPSVYVHFGPREAVDSVSNSAVKELISLTFPWCLACQRNLLNYDIWFCIISHTYKFFT